MALFKWRDPSDGNVRTNCVRDDTISIALHDNNERELTCPRGFEVDNVTWGAVNVVTFRCIADSAIVCMDDFTGSYFESYRRDLIRFLDYREQLLRARSTRDPSP